MHITDFTLTFEYKLFDSAAIDCGAPNLPEKMTFSPADVATTYGQSIFLMCASGYRHNDSYSGTGTKEYNCTESGLWTHTQPDGTIITHLTECKCK